MITSENVYGDLKDLLGEILQATSYQYNGANHYEVRFVRGEDCKLGNKPVIYYSDLDFSGGGFGAMSTGRLPCAFTVGVKANCKGNHHGFNEQVSALVNVFSEALSRGHTFDVTFKGASYTGVTLDQFGITKSVLNTMVRNADTNCNCDHVEMTVTLDLYFPVKS